MVGPFLEIRFNLSKLVLRVFFSFYAAFLYCNNQYLHRIFEPKFENIGKARNPKGALFLSLLFPLNKDRVHN